jgi:hypothetical protein
MQDIRNKQFDMNVDRVAREQAVRGKARETLAQGDAVKDKANAATEQIQNVAPQPGSKGLDMRQGTAEMGDRINRTQIDSTHSPAGSMYIVDGKVASVDNVGNAQFMKIEVMQGDKLFKGSFQRDNYQSFSKMMDKMRMQGLSVENQNAIMKGFLDVTKGHAPHSGSSISPTDLSEKQHQLSAFKDAKVLNSSQINQAFTSQNRPAPQPQSSQGPTPGQTINLGNSEGMRLLNSRTGGGGRSLEEYGPMAEELDDAVPDEAKTDANEEETAMKDIW